MRRRFATLVTSAALSVAAAGVGVHAAGAAAASAAPRVDIVKVSGLIDPINADLVVRAVATAGRERAIALVIQLNATGGVVTARRLDAVVAAIRSAPVPVAVWVGGSSRPRAYGQAWSIARAADVSGAGPGARVGAGQSLTGDAAVAQGLLTVSQPTLVDFIGSLDGRSVKGTTIVVGAGHGFRKDIQFSFNQLSVLPKLLHTAASPNVAYVMALLALALVVFEFFTAGVGVSAGTGLVLGGLSAYGLGVLPTRPGGVALLVGSVLAFSIDLQAGAPRVWTGVGVMTFLAGSVLLYSGLAVSPWVIILMGVLLALFMVSGMPAMVRTRFSTPTIGRQSMIGEIGVAVSGLHPEGTVEVHGAPWRARTNRATPIGSGDVIRVVAIDGLLLEVEPETGGARDAHH